jgi:putative flippase GtrA
MNINSYFLAFHKIVGKVLNRHFLFYAIIGFSGAGIDYGVYILLLKFLGWNYLWANILSTSIGITNNFILNAFLNFKVRDRLFKRFLSFYGVGLLGLVVAMALLWAQVGLIGISPVIAKLLTIIVVVLLQYNLNKRLSFARTSKADI